VQNIFKRLFRVYAHIYYCHFERISALGAEPHLNTCFKHFMHFVYEFNLVPNKSELAPLQELIDKLLERDAKSPPAAPLSADSSVSSLLRARKAAAEEEGPAGVATTSRSESAAADAPSTAHSRGRTRGIRTHPISHWHHRHARCHL